MSEPIDDDDIQNIVRQELEDAQNHIESTVGPDRAEATKYYRGEPFGDEETGQSQIVSMDLRDSTQAIMPSLMRFFFGSDHVVEYAPHGPEDVAVARTATDYVKYIVTRDNNGFSVGYDAFKDALIRKVGFIKAWEEIEQSEPEEFSGLTEQDLIHLSSVTAHPATTSNASSPAGQTLIVGFDSAMSELYTGYFSWASSSRVGAVGLDHRPRTTLGLGK